MSGDKLGESKVDCPRCRKLVAVLVSLGNIYCNDCRRWLMPASAYQESTNG